MRSFGLLRVSSRHWEKKKPICWAVTRVSVVGSSSARRTTVSLFAGILTDRSYSIVVFITQQVVSRNLLLAIIKIVGCGGIVSCTIGERRAHCSRQLRARTVCQHIYRLNAPVYHTTSGIWQQMTTSIKIVVHATI